VQESSDLPQFVAHVQMKRDLAALYVSQFEAQKMYEGDARKGRFDTAHLLAVELIVCQER
jgi:hypothetical protein